MALGNVINALAEKASQKDSRKQRRTFIPYRNSKLTRVLQESLGELLVQHACYTISSRVKLGRDSVHASVRKQSQNDPGFGDQERRNEPD